MQDEANDETDIEIEPSEVTEILSSCRDKMNQNELIKLIYRAGPRRSLSYSSPLTEIRTPMKNTVLHIAAWYGNDKIVSLVIEHAPKLFFEFNENNESALHIAARGGHINIVDMLLEAYTNIQRYVIKRAWLEYNQNIDDSEDYDEESNMEDLLEFVKIKNVEGNTMFHEAMLCRDIKGGDMIFKVCEVYKTEDFSGNSLSNCGYEYALDIVNNENKTILYLAVENGHKDAVKIIMENCPKNDAKPKGLSPVVAAILKRNRGEFSITLKFC